MGKLTTIPGVMLLSAGEGNPPVTRDDLEQVIKASGCPAVGAPVLALSQVDPRFDGEPALGSIVNLRLDGDKLIGDLRVLPHASEAVQAVRASGRRGIVSAGRDFKCQIGHRHPMVLSSLSMFGALPPDLGLQNLGDIRRRYAGDFNASNGDSNMEAGDISAAHALIMAAVGRGAISGQRALEYARQAAAGEDISHVANLTGVRSFAAAAANIPDLPNRVYEVLAHSNAQVAQLMHDAVDKATGQGAYAGLSPDEIALRRLFNPNNPLNPATEDDLADENGLGHYQPPNSHLIYPGEEQGRPDRTAIAWDGYTRASAADDNEPTPEHDALYDPNGNYIPVDERQLDPRQRLARAAASDDALDDEELDSRVWGPVNRRPAYRRPQPIHHFKPEDR